MFCILYFAPIQLNLACFTWKGALDKLYTHYYYYYYYRCCCCLCCCCCCCCCYYYCCCCSSSSSYNNNYYYEYYDFYYHHDHHDDHHHRSYYFLIIVLGGRDSKLDLYLLYQFVDTCKGLSRSDAEIWLVSDRKDKRLMKQTIPCRERGSFVFGVLRTSLLYGWHKSRRASKSEGRGKKEGNQGRAHRH